MSKIKEVIVEPSVIYTGSTFKLKIKATRGATYRDLKEKTYKELKNFTYGELKGD